MKALRDQARDLAAAKGFLGGCMNFHPWRDSIERWRFDVEGPHFNVMGPATWLEPGGDDEDDGWNFIANPRRYRRVPEMFEVIAYDLTHVGVVPGRPVLTWWGAARVEGTHPDPSKRRGLKLDPRVLARIKAIEDGSHVVCSECNGTNTYTVMATPEDLERWGLGGRHRHGRGAVQHRFKCNDCGAGGGTEPVPRERVAATRPVNPWHYEDRGRPSVPRGDHWTDGGREE